MKKITTACLLFFLAATGLAGNLFTGTLTNFWSMGGSWVSFQAAGYNTATNIQVVVLIDTNTIFASGAHSGQGLRWSLMGGMEFDGTNLIMQTTFESAPNSDLDVGYITITNFAPGTNLFSLSVTTAVTSSSYFVVSNAGSAGFNGTYPGLAGLTAENSGTNWWINGTNYLVYQWYQPSTNTGSLHADTTNGVGWPTSYIFFGPTNPANGQAFTASIYYGDGVPGDSPAPSVWYFQTDTTNSDAGFVLTGGGIASSVAIPPAATPASLSFVTSTAVAPPALIILSNGVVGWVNSRAYVSSLQTNVVLSSSRITIYTTNTFVFSGSNYVGRFAQLYDWTVTTPSHVPVGFDGPCPATNQYEGVWCSYTGTNGWFLATNGFVTSTNVSVSIVGAAGGYGSVTLFGLDHPELYGRTNSFDGQNWLVNGSPIASQADIAATVHVLSPPVQLAGNWLFDSSAPTTTNETVSFTAYNTPIFQLLAISSGVHLDNFYLTTTNTFFAGIDVAQTNLLSGWILEQCTNLAPPVVWNTFTNFTTTTNAGELTLIVPHDANIPAAFFRIRGAADISATFNAPLVVNGSLTASNYVGGAAGLTNANPLTLFSAGAATVLGSNVMVNLSNASPATLALFCITNANGSLTYAISNSAPVGGGGTFGGGAVSNLTIGQWAFVTNTTDNSLVQTNLTYGVVGTISLTNGIVIMGGRAFVPGVPTLGPTNGTLIAWANLDANAQNNSMSLTWSNTSGTQVTFSNYFVINFSQSFPAGFLPHFSVSWGAASTIISPFPPLSVSNTLSTIYLKSVGGAMTASKVFQLNLIGF
jgi:hypothetical protein